MADDQVEDLIRTDYRNLEDPNWWKSLGGDGVVFYGWGSGKYVKIVRAIKRAGLILVSHMDSGGMLGVFNGFSAYARSLWRVGRGERGDGILATLHFAARLGYSATLGVIRNDFRRARHLKYADLIGAISPVALERIRKVCRFYGGDRLARRVQLVPHPNASYMVPDPTSRKERMVLAVGRWEDVRVKGTDMLIKTADLLLRTDSAVRMEIFGRVTPIMETWHQHLPRNLQSRVNLCGVVPNTVIRRALQRAQVEVCTSLREGYHTVSAEALCCGCSVVGPDVPEIPSMKWFTDGPYGRLTDRSPTGLLGGIVSELAAWSSGLRSADAISSHWGRILHSPRVAEKILRLVGQSESPPIDRADPPEQQTTHGQ